MHLLLFSNIVNKAYYLFSLHIFPFSITKVSFLAYFARNNSD